MKRTVIVTTILLVCIVVVGGWFVNRQIRNLFEKPLLSQSAYPTFKNSWQFAVIGDTEDVRPITKILLADMATRNVDFVVHVGDIASHGDPEKMREVQTLFKALPFPTYYIPGNNDLIYNDSLQIKTLENYTAVFGDTTYSSFNAHNAHIILLDNSYLRYGFSDDELAWLADDLARNTQPFTFLFFHRPLHLPGEQFFGDDETPHSREQNEKFLSLIEQYPITRIFNGHIHIPIDYTLGNTAIPVTVTGGGGALPQDILGGAAAAQFHYTIVTVGDAGTTPLVERVPFTQ